MRKIIKIMAYIDVKNYYTPIILVVYLNLWSMIRKIFTLKHHLSYLYFRILETGFIINYIIRHITIYIYIYIIG